MSKMKIQVAYESEDPNVHTMDVEQLAPSLLAIGNLCKRANTMVNGDGATVRVLVESDFEHKCFLVHLQVVQDIYHQVQSLLINQDIKTSKELLEWLGLIEFGFGGFGLFKYLKEKRGRTIHSIESSDEEGSVKIIFEGDNNSIVVNQNVYKLSQDQTVISAVKAVLQPTQSPGINAIEFRDKERVIETIGREEAAEIIANENPQLPVDDTQLAAQVIDARLVIHAAEFDQESRMWKFIFGALTISVDISDSGIAEDVLRRGGIRIGDGYLVKLEITEHKTAKGYRNHYRALSFSQFLPAEPTPKSADLFKTLDKNE